MSDTTKPGPDTVLPDLYAALDSALTVMTFSSNDWSASGDFAWLYGILVGWENEPGDGGSIDELAARFKWSTDDVARLRRLRAAVAAFDINMAAEASELRSLFQLQWKRMDEATERWRAEDPQARARVQPDLGNLLSWLMDDADRARAAATAKDGDR